MANNFLLYDRYVKAVTNTTTDGSELVEQSADLTYPKIKTLTAGDGVVLVNTDNSVEISTVSSKDGILRGSQTLTYSNVVVSTNPSSGPAELALAFTDVSGELVSNYNTATGVFTVPRTGNYLVSFSTRYAMYGDVHIDVRSNNTSLGKYTRSTNGGTTGTLMDFTFSLPFAFVQGTSVTLVIEADSLPQDGSQANIANKQMVFSIVSLG